MDKVTKIETQIKNKNRVNVYINEVYTLSCDFDIIIKLGIKEGSMLDKNKFEELIKTNNLKRAFHFCINYLSYRSRTREEIFKYLEKREFTEEVINQTLEKLIYYKYVDDRQYCMNYIANAVIMKKKSKSRLKLELGKKGISAELLEECLLSYPPDADLITAKDLSEKYFYKNSNLTLRQLKNKLSQMLIRRGFDWNIISICISELEENEEVTSTILSNEKDHQDKALKLGTTYLTKYSKKEDNKFILIQKISSALYRRGYEKHIIEYVIESIIKI